MSERAETISKRRVAASTRCENLSGLRLDSGGVDIEPLFFWEGEDPFGVACAGTTWESVSITKDMAGLSFNPALVETAMAGWAPKPERLWGITRLKVGEEAS